MEQVLVVRRDDFFAGSWPHGFQPLGASDGATLLERFRQASFFVERPAAEQQSAWKQLIPYCVIVRTDEVFCVQRKKAQTEDRLHGLLSIGIGGHVNPGPEDPRTGAPGFFAAALRRELDEELVIPWQELPPPELIGLLNDDSNAVGQVHVGLAYRLESRNHRPGEPPAEHLRVREISKMVGGFRSLVELEPLWQDPQRFESWSRILLEAGIAGHKAAFSDRRSERRKHQGREEPSNG